MTLEQFEAMKNAAIDWQFLIVQSGGMARKSDCEAWLMGRFSELDHYNARLITNLITEGPRYFTCSSRDGVTWHEITAGRPAPKAEDYPDIDYGKGKL